MDNKLQNTKPIIKFQNIVAGIDKSTLDKTRNKRAQRALEPETEDF